MPGGSLLCPASLRLLGLLRFGELRIGQRRRREADFLRLGAFTAGSIDRRNCYEIVFARLQAADHVICLSRIFDVNGAVVFAGCVADV